MITIAVCDDEPSMLCDMAARLDGYMERRGLKCRILCFESGKALLDGEERYDILFLDVQMESPDGMETARLLRGRGFHGPLVFMTVLKERVFDSFEVQAFDYLVKPVEETRFKRTLDRSLTVLEQSYVKQIIVHRGGASLVIPVSEVLYCEVIARKIYLHRQDGGTVDYYGKLEELERQVDSRFFKCHRSYLVNLDYVRGCHDGVAALSNGSEIPVSRLREPEFTNALLLHMRERRR